MTSGQHIDYDALALEALRGVVRACLAQVARTGLLGDHHFYIAFNTQAPGVGMSKRLKEKYPVEMTIVLQHRFWDLAVDEERFEVKLTFDGIPERLVVPFAAVKVFYDPSVPYVLQFEEVEAGGETARRGARRGGRPTNAPAAGVGAREAGEQSADAAPSVETTEPRRTIRRPRLDDEVAAPEPAAPQRSPRPAAPPAAVEKPKAPVPAAPPGAKPAIAAVGKSQDADAGSGSDAEKPAAEGGGGAKIFDLSKFRGKK